ncbi:MAG: diphthine--ammonia ligase [Candidatus Thermoplasmatota archaeon]|nr:diphthine--ammonia ligase [Candidatus Thermoplasmatota archaeon]
MNCAVLFSGGKDSTYAAYLAKKEGYTISCLISIISENPESYMFHTPSILKVEKQAEVMNIPIIKWDTKGEKELELVDLENAIKKAKDEYNIETIVTGAVQSIYQVSRIKKICDKLDINCFNPLWQKNQIQLLQELVENKFEIIIIGVFAYPLDKKWLGRKIDKKFIEDVKKLQEKFYINPAGEGGEFETFVVNCPLFEKKLKIINKEIMGKKNSWKMEILVK